MQGLGTDIIEIARIERVIERYGSKFLDRIYTKTEQEYCLKYRESARHFSGRFAAKEAIVKSLGTGINKDINWKDIEIVNDSHGKPTVIFSESLKEMFDHPHVLISISHCKEYATATAILL